MFLPLYDSNPHRHITRPYVNYGLIGACCVVFVIQQALPPAEAQRALLSFGMVPLYVLDPLIQPVPWLPDQVTLLTYAFLHADWLHLLSNMLFLFIFGDNIEDALGHFRYLVFYLLCAIAAGLAHLLFQLTMIDSAGPLIGASGAIAGVMGAYALLYPRARVLVLFRIVIPIPIPIPAIWMLGVWFVVQLFNGVVGTTEPVAWWAHVGGMIAGALLVLVMKRGDVELFGGAAEMGLRPDLRRWDKPKG